MQKPFLFSKQVTNIFFHILTQCNLSCRHCYINPEQHGYKPLTIDTINLWLKLFLERKSKTNVVFLGGEPTMHPYLSLAVKSARKLGYNSIIIDTNGYQVVKVLKEIDPGDVDLFSFSLDGPTVHSNDMLRGKGSYECCINGILKAKRKGFKTSLIFTVSMANFQYLYEMPAFLSRLKVDHFFIQVIGLRGKWLLNKNRKKMLEQVDDISWLEIIPDIANKIANRGIAVTYPKVFLNPDDIFECAGLVAKNYFVFPNGRVYLCPLCEDYPIHGKEIKENILVDRKGINESSLFSLTIPEGCVMNRIIQPTNITYTKNGNVKYRIACCMLKEELRSK